MAEEIVSQTSQSLVLQTEREKFFSKLQNMRLNNLTAKQQTDLSQSKVRFIKFFISLSYIFFGLSREQLKEFNEDELKVLSELISRKARPWQIYQMLFTFGVPFFGWIFGGTALTDESTDFRSCKYLRYRKNLRKICGENYFPFGTFQQYL